MSALTVFVLVLWIVGVFGLFAEAWRSRSLGWLGAALIALAVLLGEQVL